MAFVDVMQYHEQYRGIPNNEMRRLWRTSGSDPIKTLKDSPIPKKYHGLIMRLPSYFDMDTLDSCEFRCYKKGMDLTGRHTWCYVYSSSPGTIAVAAYVAEAIGCALKSWSRFAEFTQHQYGKPVLVDVGDDGNPLANPIW